MWSVAVVVGMILAAAQGAFAWGPEGHQTVAMIAQERLTPEAKAKVAQLLEGKGLSDLSVVVWADLLAPKSTKPWHYVDIPLNETAYVPERDGHEGNNVIDKTVEMARLMKDTSKPIEDRQRALKYVIHFVGDMHQPLHAAERKNDDGKPDKGGNLVQVKLPEGAEPVRLHLAWDVELVKAAMAGADAQAFSQKLSKEVTPEKAKAWTQGVGADLPKEVVVGWVLEAHKVAADVVYPGVPTDGSVITLDKAYVGKSDQVIKEQLTKAGVRLAEVLNQVLGSGV